MEGRREKSERVKGHGRQKRCADYEWARVKELIQDPYGQAPGPFHDAGTDRSARLAGLVLGSRDRGCEREKGCRGAKVGFSLQLATD